jgi:hypothetical protein
MALAAAARRPADLGLHVVSSGVVMHNTAHIAKLPPAPEAQGSVSIQEAGDD